MGQGLGAATAAASSTFALALAVATGRAAPASTTATVVCSSAEAARHPTHTITRAAYCLLRTAELVATRSQLGHKTKLARPRHALHTHLVCRAGRLAPFALMLAACATKERATSAPAPTASDASSPAPSATPAASHEPAPPSACPADMVLVDGSYCPNPIQICERWLDGPGEYHEYRCAEYEKPAKCRGAREQRRFCIDREEYAEPGSALPLANQSWTSAGEVCAADRKRLCLESEWQFACEGEDMHPYPYGDGFTRDGTACNIDCMDLGKPNAGLNDSRAPITAYPRCTSPFGVHDMSGNVEEWTTLDRGVAPQRSSMKGAWWLPGKNTCRARTLGHGEIYRENRSACAAARTPGK